MRAHAVFNSITTSIFVVQLFLILLRLVGCSGFRFSVFVFFFISALLYVNVNAINLITISQAAVTILLLLINGFCNHFTCLCLAFFILHFCFHFVFVWAGRDQGAFSIFLVKLFCIVCFVLVCFCLGLDLSLCIVCLFLNLYKKCNCLFLCLCLPGFCFCRVKYKFSNTIIYTSYNTKILYTQIQKIKRTVQNLI